MHFPSINPYIPPFGHARSRNNALAMAAAHTTQNADEAKKAATATEDGKNRRLKSGRSSKSSRDVKSSSVYGSGSSSSATASKSGKSSKSSKDVKSSSVYGSGSSSKSGKSAKGNRSSKNATSKSGDDDDDDDDDNKNTGDDHPSPTPAPPKESESKKSDPKGDDDDDDDESKGDDDKTTIACDGFDPTELKKGKDYERFRVRFEYEYYGDEDDLMDLEGDMAEAVAGQVLDCDRRRVLRSAGHRGLKSAGVLGVDAKPHDMIGKFFCIYCPVAHLVVFCPLAIEAHFLAIRLGHT